jgi:hypothetical protein
MFLLCFAVWHTNGQVKHSAGILEKGENFVTMSPMCRMDKDLKS